MVKKLNLNELASIRYLSDIGVDILSMTDKIIKWAIYHKNYHLIKYIIQLNFDNEKVIPTGTIVSIARTANVEIINFLCEINPTMEYTIKALSLKAASEQGNLGVVELWVNSGFEFNSRIVNVIIKSACQGASINIIKYIDERFIIDYESALNYSLENENLEIVKYFVERGANINEIDVNIIANVFPKNYDEFICYLIHKG